MAIRNTVSIEFTVGGPGLAQLDQITARLRNFGSTTGGLNAASSALTRVGHAGTTAAAGVTRLGTASTKAGGALSRIAEIATGSFAGNVLAGIFTSAASAAAGFAKEAVGAALSAEQALVVLKTQSRLTGTDLAANLTIAKQIAKELKVSDAAGVGLATGGVRVTSGVGKPEDTLKFLRAVADLSAAAGRPLSGLTETMRQFAAGGAQAEAALDKIGGGENPGAIMDRYAKSVGTTTEKLTELQRNLALYEFVMARSIKVEGAAQESLNTTAGKVSQLSATYENIQEKIGKLIVATPLFQKGLEGLQQAAASLDSPETLSGFNKISLVMEKIGLGFGLLKADVVLFGEQFGAIWDLLGQKLGNLFNRIGLDFRALVNDAVIAMVRLIERIPAPIRKLAGFGTDIDIPGITDEALKNRAEIGGLRQSSINEANVFDANAARRFQEAQAKFDATVAGLVGDARNRGAAGAGGAAAAAQISNLAGLAGGAAGAFAADFKRVPILIETPNGLVSGFGFERVVKENTAGAKDLNANVGKLTSIMEEVNANPAFARVEFVAGENTMIRSLVPAGGAIP